MMLMTIMMTKMLFDDNLDDSDDVDDNHEDADDVDDNVDRG